MIASSPSDLKLALSVKNDIPTDPKIETFLVKLFQIVRQHAKQDDNSLCKQMIAEAFQYSEEGQSNHHSSRIRGYP